MIGAREVSEFRECVYRYYRRHGRELPWRNTRDPYFILVSEVMLQQTQVERVIPKYFDFIRQFPNVRALASAPLADVLAAWQGLGYNRRAKKLRECALRIVQEHEGAFPDTYEKLLALPGIGPYTAGALLAFASNTAVPIIETNIRTVYLHHFFKHAQAVGDRDILKYIEQTLDRKNPRTWYAALMDYGAHLKRAHGNENRRSKHYAQQSRFEGSHRQVRGAIVRTLTECPSLSSAGMKKSLPYSKDIIDEQLLRLRDEGMVEYRNRKWSLPHA